MNYKYKLIALTSILATLSSLWGMENHSRPSQFKHEEQPSSVAYNSSSVISPSLATCFKCNKKEDKKYFGCNHHHCLYCLEARYRDSKEHQTEIPYCLRCKAPLREEAEQLLLDSYTSPHNNSPSISGLKSETKPILSHTRKALPYALLTLGISGIANLFMKPQALKTLAPNKNNRFLQTCSRLKEKMNFLIMPSVSAVAFTLLTIAHTKLVNQKEGLKNHQHLENVALSITIAIAAKLLWNRVPDRDKTSDSYSTN